MLEITADKRISMIRGENCTLNLADLVGEERSSDLSDSCVLIVKKEFADEVPGFSVSDNAGEFYIDFWDTCNLQPGIYYYQIQTQDDWDDFEVVVNPNIFEIRESLHNPPQ